MSMTTMIHKIYCCIFPSNKSIKDLLTYEIVTNYSDDDSNRGVSYHFRLNDKPKNLLFFNEINKSSNA